MRNATRAKQPSGPEVIEKHLGDKWILLIKRQVAKPKMLRIKGGRWAGYSLSYSITYIQKEARRSVTCQLILCMKVEGFAAP
jgi:hypothetical protein